jgi:chromosome segregation ATPase
MSKFAGFLGRKTTVAEKLPEPALITTTPNNPLELDEELFSALGAQLGGENEALRNLMLNANAKIGELDLIKDAVGKLVDPVSKTLRAMETERAEKLALQTVLNNTRTAYGKLRNEVGDLEKKSGAFERECLDLRQQVATTQNALRTLEATKAEIAIDIAARRAQIADLEARLTQETGDAKALRDETRRLGERLTSSDKKLIALESELNSARQKMLLTEDEKQSLQASLDKTLGEAARLARKLAESETLLVTAQGRLRHVEANFAEVSTERTRLANALEEANERHEHELTSQRMRFEAMTVRSSASDKLLNEAREHLLARAEEIRDYDRRMSERTMACDVLESRVAEMENDRIQRESELHELDQAKTTLMERSAALTRAYTSKDAALARAEESITALAARMTAIETEAATSKQNAEQQIEELNAALRREQLERAVVEGALETGRKDFARLMREVMALQRSQSAREPAPQPFAANAA